MREFDDNSHSYGPVLRRIAILAAVIVMVPVMLWSITSFMRTYVAQPVIASPKPLLAPITTASINTTSANTANAATDSSASAQPATPVVEARATATDSNAPPPPAAKVAALTTSDMPSVSAPGVTNSPAANTPAINSPAANNVWPDPSQAIGGQTIGATDTPAAAATTDDALPATPPLTGRIPLPPHRPAVIAMVTPGAVPLPRVRPTDAGTPAEATTDGSGNFLNHLFGQTH